MTNDEPSAWTKKYFNAASEEYWLFFLTITGIKANKFNSSPIQALNQDTEVIESNVPKIRIIKKFVFVKEK